MLVLTVISYHSIAINKHILGTSNQKHSDTLDFNQFKDFNQDFNQVRANY